MSAPWNGPPQPGQPGWQQPMGWTGQSVHVDPASAGLVRNEKLGWGLFFAVVGLVACVVSYFLVWMHASLTGTDRDTFQDVFSELKELGPVDLGGRLVAFFDAPEGPRSNSLVDLFYPGLAIGLVLLSAILAAVAVRGLRRPALTALIRVVAVLVPLGAVILGGWTFWALDATLYDITPRDLPTTGRRYLGSADPGPGYFVWAGGLLVLAFGAGLGPRVTYALAPGAVAAHGGFGSGGPALGMPGHPMVVRRTQPIAAGFAVLGLVSGLLGYLALPWYSGGGRSAGFPEISGSARDYTSENFAGVYFSWLGWVCLVGLILGVVVVLVGLRPSRSGGLRAVAALLALAGGVLHLVALAEVNEPPDVGGWLPLVGFGLLLLGSALPLRTTAQVTQMMPFGR